MGTKYMADCAKYPYKGYYEHSISEQHIIPFILKLLKAVRKYDIINVEYRNY